MIRTNRKVFKLIYKYCKNGQTTSSINVLTALMTKMNDRDILNSIDNLVELGYITNDTEKTENNIRLTFKGEHYREYSRQEIWLFFRNSILVPIFVAFITALLVNLFIK